MTTNQNLKQLSEEMDQELKNILEFWSTKAIDNKNQGFWGQIDHLGKVNKKAVKGVVLNARILWTFSAACRHVGSKQLEEMATRAYQYLTKYFFDDELGGLYWAVDCNGQPENTRKQAYAQGFGVYAFSEYYLATGNKESLEYAKELYHLIEVNFYDEVYGGYIEALDRDWKRLDDMRLSEKDANLPKSMNTHLHLLEPYTNLYRAWPDPKLKESILHLLDIFQTKIINTTTGNFDLFFEMDWECKSKIVSYGHDIEGAWLLHEAAHEIGDAELIKKVQAFSLKLVDNTLEFGTDEDGSLFNEKENDHLDSDKHWWPQAEAMVGLMDAWEISGNRKYIVEIERIWKFIRENIIDRENGEWFWRVDINGCTCNTDDKIGFWKCPYHNSRALIEIITRIKKVNSKYGEAENPKVSALE